MGLSGFRKSMLISVVDQMRIGVMNRFHKNIKWEHLVRCSHTHHHAVLNTIAKHQDTSYYPLRYPIVMRGISISFLLETKSSGLAMSLRALNRVSVVIKWMDLIANE